MKNKDGGILKTAINYHRLKIWLDPEGGKQIPHKKVITIVVTIFSSLRFIPAIFLCGLWPLKKLLADCFSNSLPCGGDRPTPQPSMKEYELTDVISQVR